MMCSTQAVRLTALFWVYKYQITFEMFFGRTSI